MQRPDGRRGEPAQLQPQKVGEQVVVAKPRSAGVDRRHEGVGVLELLQDPLGPRGPGEEVGQGTADAVHDRRPQQQVANLGRLALEHLGQEVRRHGPFAAGELADEALAVRMGRERDRRQPESGRPAFRVLVKLRHSRVRQRDPIGLQQPARLLERETQIGAADLDQIAREAQAMEGEIWVSSRRQHHAERRRDPGEEALQQPQRVGRAQLVEVVDHQYDGLLEPVEAGQQRLDDAVPAEGGGRADALDQALLVHRAGQRIDHGQPEVLRVLLVALDRHPGHGIGPGAGPHPRPQHHRLAAARRGAEQDHLAASDARKSVEERSARDQPLHGGQPLRGHGGGETEALHDGRGGVRMSTLTGTGAGGQ